MSKKTIHDVDEENKARTQPPGTGKTLVEAIRAKLAPLGGVELDLPLREAIRELKHSDQL